MNEDHTPDILQSDTKMIQRKCSSSGAESEERLRVRNRFLFLILYFIYVIISTRSIVGSKAKAVHKSKTYTESKKIKVYNEA